MTTETSARPGLVGTWDGGITSSPLGGDLRASIEGTRELRKSIADRFRFLS
jgi:hypothetical protein